MENISTEGCNLCAHGNDLSDGEWCRACGYGLPPTSEKPKSPEGDNRLADAVREARGGDAPTPKRGFA